MPIGASKYTPEQVCQALGISGAVLGRLSQAVNIPAANVKGHPHQPRLQLYSATDVQQLQQIQTALLEGKSLLEAKALLQADLTPSSEEPFWDVSAPTPEVPQAPELVVSLVSYENDEAMKHQLAEATFRQYRQQNPMGRAVLKSLAEKVASTTGSPDIVCVLPETAGNLELSVSHTKSSSPRKLGTFWSTGQSWMSSIVWDT